MKVESAACPHCGAPVRIEYGKKTGFCEYCGMQLFMDGTEPAPREEERPERDREETWEPYADREPAAGKEAGKARGLSYWTPVGFRTKTLWKMLLAGFWYIVLIAMVVSPGESVNTRESLIIVFWMLSWIAVIFSWQPAADLLPGLKSENSSTRTAAKIGWCFLFIMIASIFI